MPEQRDSFQEYVLEQLDTLDGLSCRAMFGGHGIYQDGAFFGIVSDDRLYFKTNVETRAAYEAEGMTAFQPNEQQTIKTYYEVPADIVEDGEALVRWAQQAVAVALQLTSPSIDA